VRPLFTIHAGEFLVGEHIEGQFPDLNLWVPAKDTGVDLLVTDAKASKSVSLQVKLTRDYKRAHAHGEFEQQLVAAGWLKINHKKLENSPADLWVIVMVSHDRRREPVFLVIPPKELLVCLTRKGEAPSYHFYPWVLKVPGTEKRVVLDGRGLLKKQCADLAVGQLALGERDLTHFMGDWRRLEELKMGNAAVVVP